LSSLHKGPSTVSSNSERFLSTFFGNYGSDANAIGINQGDSTAFPADIPSVEEDLRVSLPFTYRLIEFYLSFLMALVALPICLVIAAILKSRGQGSPLYRQIRVGKNGANFTILKFRTMYENAEALGPFVYTTYNDERITPFGKFLRKNKIDELPQLWNILKGEMSLVGPRPERPCFHETNLRIRDWDKRICVKPGLTGLAQISQIIAHDPERKIVADMAYIRNRSFALNFKIILLTAFPKLEVYDLCGIPLRRRR